MDKSIIDIIKKIAQEIPVPERSRGRPPKSAPSKQVSTPQLGVNFLESVKDMQEAMQRLAQDVMRDASSAIMPLKPKDVAPIEANQNVKNSKKSFNDFMMQFTNNLESNQKGVEWDTSQHIKSLENKTKTQTDIYELDTVMDTIRRIGTGKSELGADGNWQFRTDNALKNIMGFAHALLQLEADFGLPNNIYTFANWQNLQGILSGYEVRNGKVLLSAKEKNGKAKEIINHLSSINKLYNHFRRQITGGSEYRPYIESGRPFEKYKPLDAKQQLTEKEQQLANSDVKINGIAPDEEGNQLTSIPLKALTSKEEYLKYMSEEVGIKDPIAAIKIFNNTIKPRIESM